MQRYDWNNTFNTEGDDFMSNTVFTIEKIVSLVKPLAEKYQVQQMYLFGSYARGEASVDSDFYKTIMKERLLVA